MHKRCPELIGLNSFGRPINICVLSWRINWTSLEKWSMLGIIKFFVTAINYYTIR